MPERGSKSGDDPYFVSVFVGPFDSEEEYTAYLDVGAGGFYGDTGLRGPEHEAVECHFEPGLWRKGRAAFAIATS